MIDDLFFISFHFKVSVMFNAKELYSYISHRYQISVSVSLGDQCIQSLMTAGTTEVGLIYFYTRLCSLPLLSISFQFLVTQTIYLNSDNLIQVFLSPYVLTVPLAAVRPAELRQK